MKKILSLSGFVVLLLIGSSLAIANTAATEKEKILEPVLAPENSEFLEYQKNLGSAQPDILPEQKTGLIPSPVNLNYLNPTLFTGTPTPGDYDLRTLNKVTPVKDQGRLGTCWIFATYGSLESYLKPEENWDFSENNLKNLLIVASPEGFDRGPNGGGNQFISTAYLARWNGPVAESDDPYSPYSITSSNDLSSQKHVQNVLFLSDRKGSLDNNEIKQAIQNYGAIFTSMYYNNTFYSPTNYSYYYNGSSSSNHGVNIVGWNDSFDRNKFSVTPPGNGAFIIKNSWGSGWGDYGYFYVSYYDSKIGTSNSCFMAESPDNYKFIYQYDPLGWTSALGYSNSSAWCANVFTAKSSEILKAVSFYTTDSNCSYELYVYTNSESNPINQLGPVFSKNGKILATGYHTIPLNSGVQLKAGQKFSVVLKLTNQEYNYPIVIETPIPGWSSKAKANTGESFISPDGVTWTDITTYYSNTNVCIKAFTV